VENGVRVDETIEVGDTVLFLDGKVHWSVKDIIEWLPNPKFSSVHLESQMTGHRRTAMLSQLKLHSKATADA
jgi:hypothetical protein